MCQDAWAKVDDYLSELLVKSDAALEQALTASTAAGLPEINVTPNQGKLLHLMARAQGARNILEVGTLGGYSTIWLARALPQRGRLITLEYDPKHAEVAHANILNAGMTDRVEIIVGRAIDTLPQLAAENRGPFDFVFIDADKPSTADYFEWALRLTRPGSLIVVDNVVRKGAVVEAASDDANVQGVRRFLEMAAAEPRVDVTAIQTVGSKGYDGFALALIVATP